MKRELVTLFVLGAAGVVCAQQPAGTYTTTAESRAAIEAQNVAGGRARGAVEARITQGAPYAGEAITEFTQVLADGNRISRRSVTRTFRDSEGRTRREQTTLTEAGESVSITIVDPVARTSFILDPQTRTVRRASVAVAMPTVVAPSGFGGGGRGGRGGAGVVAPATTPGSAAEAQRREAERSAAVDLAENSRSAAGTLRATQERAASGAGHTTTESLGQQMVEGVMAEGTRTTTVIPAGSIGNAQPITIVSEQWFSPDLQILLLTRHSDPRTGETVYRLSNIVRGEPDRSLFEVPSDYTMKEPTATLSGTIIR